MSPTSSASAIYDHLLINFHQQPKLFTRHGADSANCNQFVSTTLRKSIPPDEQAPIKRQYTITHIPVSEPIVRCSVSNQVYDRGLLRKSPLPSAVPETSFQASRSAIAKTNAKSSRVQLSTPTFEDSPTDFRPLIINGRRRFTTLPSSSPMIIIKKKSPSPMHGISLKEKPLLRSLPVNTTSSHPAVVVSTVIPSSLSYSSSCSSSSASASSTHIGSISVPIQVIKTQKNNNNTNPTTSTTIESQKGYRYVQRPSPQAKLLTSVKVGNKVQPSVPRPNDDDQPARISSSSSSGFGDDRSSSSTMMTDSNVLRLIRRYDPIGSSLASIQARRSLESTRGEWRNVAPKSVSSSLSNASSASCSVLPQQGRTSTHADNGSVKLSSTPRLQRQKAIQEQESLPSSPQANRSIKPILKNATESPRMDLRLPAHKTEPLTIDIEPHLPPPPVINKDDRAAYQPLITTGTKRVCAAMSKSDWDLRSQLDAVGPAPSQAAHSPSPRPVVEPQPRATSYRPLLGRSQSVFGMNNHPEQDDDVDDFDENSAPILSGSSIDKLKKVFITKSSLDLTNVPISNQHRVSSIESSLSRNPNSKVPDLKKTDSISSVASSVQKMPKNSGAVETQPLKTSNTNVIKPTMIVQEAILASSPLSRKPIFRTQKTMPNSESLNPSNNTSTMPSSELSYDAYRFRRLNDHEQMTTSTNPTARLRNVAKVEPYSINPTLIRPLFQSSPSPSSSLPSTKILPTTTTATTVAPPSQARNVLNSMGNTPTHSSASSSAGSLNGMIRHPNVRQSDFLVPNPAYAAPAAVPSAPSVAPSASHRSQRLSNSSSYATPPPPSRLLSDSLSQRSAISNVPLYSERSSTLATSINDHPQKHRGVPQEELHSTKQPYSPLLHRQGNGALSRQNTNKYEKFDNYTAPITYHYRSRDVPASTTAVNTSFTADREKSQGSTRAIIADPYHHQQQQQEERAGGGGPQQQQQASRRRFQRRKQMKRSKSADLYHDPSSANHHDYFASSTLSRDMNKHDRQPRSTSREHIAGREGDGNLSDTSSESSSSTANIERINRAALMRYKSLDSMAFNSRKANPTGKNLNRKFMSKPMNMDFDSDDSVCGIPKPRKLCNGSKTTAKSERNLLETNRPIGTHSLSSHDIGHCGSSTGITNSIHKRHCNDEQINATTESYSSLYFASTTTTAAETNQYEESLMRRGPTSGLSFAESQFYARTSNTPTTKRQDLIYRKSDDICPLPPANDTFHDALEEFHPHGDQIIGDQQMPTKIYIDWTRQYDEDPIKPPTHNAELFIMEATDIHPSTTFPTKPSQASEPAWPSPRTKVLNPFERLRPLELRNEEMPSSSSTPNEPSHPSFTRPLKSSVERMQMELDEQDADSSLSTANRSIHLPVEKQRGLSEVIRKRNSRFKVEDYKRSFQRSNTFDEQQCDYYRPITTSKSDQTLTAARAKNPVSSPVGPESPQPAKRLTKTKSFDIPIDVEGEHDQRTPTFAERPSGEKTNEDEDADDKLTVAAKRNLFETFSKDTPTSSTLTRSKSLKQENSIVTSSGSKSPMLTTRKYATGKQRAQTELLLGNEDNEISPEQTSEKDIFDDDTSKLSFKEKMVLFNQKKSAEASSSASEKSTRSRLTQPITAEEVQAAEHLSVEPSPPSSPKEPATPLIANDKPFVHDNSLSLSITSLSEECFFPARSILQASTFEENRADEKLLKHLSTRHIEETNMMSAEEAENIIPVSKRLELLKNYGENEWKKRVKSTNDAADFTVEGKLRQAGKAPTSSDDSKSPATSSRKAPTLKYGAKKTNTDQDQRAKTVDVVRLKAESSGKTKDIVETSSSTKKTNGTATSKAAISNTVLVLKSDTVSVLKPDDHLEQFFAEAKKSSNNESSLQLNADDLNRIAENAVRLQSQPTRVRPPRRQQQGAKNPLRQIQATIPTANEYTEVHTNISEQELRRLKRAQIAENAGLAEEALAALAATENFAEINLRKIDRSSLATFGFEPYKDLMLILIKGRRHCSLRLVNPNYHSINEGDCYLLITPSKVFGWLGRYANALEKAKTMDIVDYLKQHRDFGLRSEAKYFILDQANDDTENDIHAEFGDILRGEHDDYKSIDHVTDDDFYEANIMELNRVYRLDNDMLIPLDDFCFRSLSVKILDPNDVFVFDFGAEVYVWNGKYADKIKRQMGLQLAQQLWSDPYDFSECLMNPFDPLDDKSEQSSQTHPKRPSWCIFGKQNQNVETLLFKGKFYDWPGDLKELKPVNDAAHSGNRIPSARRPPSIVEMLKPADVHKMLLKQDNPVNMILEQASLGRGKHWYDRVELRGHDVQTISLNVWHVSDNDRHELSSSSYGQFHSDDVYIIRWRYKLVASGFHSLATGKASVRKTDTGRDRVAYWIWQGIHASSNEKGISALMTVFLDEEKGPHIHVLQEREEPTFLQLFDGTLTIHTGKRNQSSQMSSHWRLYVFLGEIDVETHWWQLTVNIENLRSQTSFLLTNDTSNTMLLWHGCRTTDERKQLAHRSAMKLRDRSPEEFRFNDTSHSIEIIEMQEGDETDLFWQAINERTRQRKYYSLLNVQSDQNLTATMRIFHLSSLHGPFVAQELIYLLRSPDHISPFPFTQADLYELPQPALCLIDAGTEMYIWQGWSDLSDDELDLQLYNANLQAGGPRDMRFTAERRCAFRTAVEYCKEKAGSTAVQLPCSIVYAGLEPMEFINLFPKWTVHLKARQQNLSEGKKLDQRDSVPDILKHLCREQYTIEELRTRPLPEGVDPSKIESYLSDDDFEREFHMTKDDFYALPYWKQTNVKKPLGFF